MTRTAPQPAARRARRTSAIAVTALVALLGGCGTANESGAPSTPTRIEIPDTVVRHLQDGADIRLADAVSATQPTLLWFWAPH